MIFNGLPLVQRLVQRLEPLAESCFIITNDPTEYRFFPTPKVADVLPGRGALGGLYTALVNANTEFVAVIACDMPFANPGLLAYQSKVLSEDGADVAIPTIHGRHEPFHAIYRRETCLPLVKQALDAEEWKALSWLHFARVREITAEEVRSFDPHGITFTNVNNPTEFKVAESLDRSLSKND